MADLGSGEAVNLEQRRQEINEAALTEMLAEMCETYEDVFGRQPTDAQIERFLAGHPGAVELWRSVSS